MSEPEAIPNPQEVAEQLDLIVRGRQSLLALSGSWFRQLRDGMVFVATRGPTLSAAEAARYWFNDVENAYKDKTGKTRMPVVYRSAKSVLLRAQTELPKEDLRYFSKSGMQRALKHNADKADKTMLAWTTFTKAMALWDEAPNDAFRESILETMRQQIEARRKKL